MALIVNADLTGLQTFPPEENFVLGVPVSGLVTIFRAGVRVDDGAVAEWLGSSGYSATQAGASVRPTSTGTVITFNGTSQYLGTDVIPAASGYVVAKIVAKTLITTPGVIVGESADSTNRLSLGYASDMKPAFQVGSTTFTTLRGTTVMVADTEYTIGGQWAAGSASVRVNGTSEKTLAYTGGVGGLALSFGARNVSGTPDLYCPAHIKAIAVYSGSSLDLAAIDAAMAAF